MRGTVASGKLYRSQRDHSNCQALRVRVVTMSENDPISSAKTAIEVVGAVMKGAAADPQVRVAAHELGKTAVTLTKAINTFLLPLAVMNYAVEKARRYFEQRFSVDFEEVARKIPADQIVEPKPSIAGPILQALAFAHEEVPLKQMYLELLASAMDGRIARDAHPAFVEIIKQMTSEEARLLRRVVRDDGGTPLFELRKRTSKRWLRMFSLSESFVVLATHVQDIVRSDTREPSETPHLPAMVDNWARLGLCRRELHGEANGRSSIRLDR